MRIFLASSEELREDRDAFDLHVRQRNDRWLDRGIHLEPVRWENFVDALSATGLQSEYNRAISECDVFVMLFRTKVGKYTAEEFEKAFGQFKETGRPLIYTYFNKVQVDLGELDEDDFASLRGFQKKLKALGHFQTVYENPDSLLLHFTEQLERLYPLVAPPPAPAASVSATPANLTVYLTRRAAHWRSGAAGQLDRRFVNLTLMIDHGLEHNGPRHEADSRFDRLSDLLAQRSDVGAWVLVGLPGSGKSTVLQHHEMSTADAALQIISGATSDADPPEVCIWQRLSEYSVDDPPPDEWLALPGRWPQDLPAPDRLRQVARVRFLLDGLNEIKAPDRAGQLAAIDRWTDWAACHAGRGDALAPVFSVRTLDQSPMSTSGFEVRQIQLNSWSPEQMRAYCAHTLGEGNALWPTIEADPHLLELSALPFNLAAQCELFHSLGHAARNRAELMAGLFWQMLVKRSGDRLLKVSGLLGDADWRQVANGQWKQLLPALPDRHGCLVPWLDEALQRLHRHGRQVSVAQGELLAELARRGQGATPEDWLQAVRSLQLIDEGGYAPFSTEPLLRCTHQLWQEFFAARGIRDWAAACPERLPDLRAPALTPIDQLQLGLQEPLPGPGATHWEEPVKLAVQLLPDPLPWVRTLLPLNLALAARAALACRERLEQAHGPQVLDALRQALLKRSRDPAADLRLRIEAGALLGELGDPRWEARQGPQGRYLWPRTWVKVPGGAYRIGADQAPYTDETPETAVTLAPFEMAFAPVTNAEFRCFIDAGGYRDERWWEGDTARQWLKEGVRNEQSIRDWTTWLAALREDFDEGVQRYFPGATEAWKDGELRKCAGWSPEEAQRNIEASFGARTYNSPGFLDNPLFNAPTQPVVGVCLYEARAYACWLAAQTGLSLRLPTEAQWEAAARGPAGRRWPWGDGEPDPGRINADPAHLRRTSPVGVFPDADSPEGLTDMSGNVWEWTLSAYTDRHDAAALVAEAPAGPARRAVRGGAWDDAAGGCRASDRSGGTPVARLSGLGLRLVVVVGGPIQGAEP